MLFTKKQAGYTKTRMNEIREQEVWKHIFKLFNVSNYNELPFDVHAAIKFNKDSFCCQHKLGQWVSFQLDVMDKSDEWIVGIIADSIYTTIEKFKMDMMLEQRRQTALDFYIATQTQLGNKEINNND